MKVKIIVQNGQTGLRKVGSIVNVSPELAKHWKKNKWAKSLTKAK